VTSSLLASNATYAEEIIAGIKIIAWKLLTADFAAAGGRLLLQNDGEGGRGSLANVSVPASLLEDVGEGAVLVVSTMFPGAVDELTGTRDGEESPAHAVVHINVYGNSGDVVSVAGIPEPLEIGFTVNSNYSLSCGYWDEVGLKWTSDGLHEIPGPEGTLICSTSHLSLFGAFLDGFLNAFLCSQATLLSREGYQGILKNSGWYYATGPLILWGILLVFCGIQMIACALDCRRRRRVDCWTEDCFLIPMSGDGPSGQEGGDEEAPSSGCSCCATCSESCSGPCRDALDDIMSSFFEFFGDIRNLCEEMHAAVAEAMSNDSGAGSCILICQAMTMGMLWKNAQRQATASLGMSLEDAQFLVGDGSVEELTGQDDHLHDTEHNNGETNVAVTSKGSQRRLELLTQLKGVLAEKHDEHMALHYSWHFFPMMVVRGFARENPIGSVFERSVLCSSSMRSLFLILDVLGALLIATLFFSSTGGAPSNNNPPVCDLEPDFWGNIGRLVAVALMSSLLAGIPISILGSLHTRSFKRFAFEGCPGWERQLRHWRQQDRMIWVCGSAYGLFSVNFVVLFFANVEPKDHLDWITSAAIGACQDFMLVPFAISFVFPLLGFSFLAVLSCCMKAPKKDLLGRTSPREEAAGEAAEEAVREEQVKTIRAREQASIIEIGTFPNSDSHCRNLCTTCASFANDRSPKEGLIELILSLVKLGPASSNAG
jgi:hypothetical protein